MSVLEGPLVFVDIETNGLNAYRGRIIEVAAIRVENGKVTDSFSSLVDPGTELPQFITSLTGISSNDLVSAPAFADIADRLYSLLDGATFVAHNVRFDFSFIKEEFRRLNISYSARQLCSVRLSRALFPAERGHKLQDIINRCRFDVKARHRAYDDAEVILKFFKYLESSLHPDMIDQAIARQLKSPRLPTHLKKTIIEILPDKPGVYIFEDELGSALYIGKSINIKNRVQSHFTDDSVKEMKISHLIKNISHHQTPGELSALLLESRLIKERQPVYNTMLRRHNKMTIARKSLNNDGYLCISIEDVESISPDLLGDILSVYSTKRKARTFMDELCKTYGICPRVLGLEKGTGPCFSYQLKKCKGACVNEHSPEEYNSALESFFETNKLQDWPFASPMIVEELGSDNSGYQALVIDQWCVIAEIAQEEDCSPQIEYHKKVFDIDSYRILKNYFEQKRHKLNIQPINLHTLEEMTTALQS